MKHLNTHPQCAYILPKNFTNYFDYQKRDGFDEGLCGVITISFLGLSFEFSSQSFLVVTCDLPWSWTREATLKLSTQLIPKWDWRWAQWQGKTGMWTISLWLNRKASSPGQRGKKKFNQISAEKRNTSDHIHEKCHPLNNHSRILVLWLYLPPGSVLPGNWVFLEQFLILARIAMSQVAQTLWSKAFIKDII